MKHFAFPLQEIALFKKDEKAYRNGTAVRQSTNDRAVVRIEPGNFGFVEWIGQARSGLLGAKGREAGRDDRARVAVNSKVAARRIKSKQPVARER